ncbi:MAG: rod shape-determining protein MreD [Lachnospiraceae bacterium]|nr:rod shape-determining protein MreD [Lachnospiraceae bacterium]
MIKRIISTLISIAVAFLMQTCLLRYLPTGRATVDLLLLITCIFGFMRGEYAGMISGILCGLTMDIFYSGGLGLYTLIYLYVGYLNGLCNRFFEEKDFKMPLALIFSSELAYLLLYFLLFYVFSNNFNFSDYVSRRMLPELLLTCVSAVIIYPLLLFLEVRVINYDPGEEERNRQNLAQSVEREVKG